MTKKITEANSESRGKYWEVLEEMIREKIQEWVQQALDEELSEFLGREKSVRRTAVDAAVGYRNGHGKPRRLTLPSGTIALRRPRVRGVDEKFESRLLPLFVTRTRTVGEMLPELYLHGLAEGDFDLALRGLLGENAALSPSTVARLKERWQGELEEWQQRSLAELEPVYLWVDGIHVKAGFEAQKSAVLVALAALSDGRKVLLTLRSGHRESTESWLDLLRDLRRRGLNPPKLVIGDGALGFWSAVGQVYPEIKEQRCWNHKILNILDKVPKKQQGSAKLMLRQIVYADSRRECERHKQTFITWCRRHHFAEAANCLDRDWARMISFFEFPKQHWQHIRTTNPIESPFAALRLRTDAAKRFKRVDHATAVLWKMLLVAETRFRKLKHPDLLLLVYRDIRYIDGIEVKERAA